MKWKKEGRKERKNRRNMRNRNKKRKKRTRRKEGDAREEDKKRMRSSDRRILRKRGK